MKVSKPKRVKSSNSVKLEISQEAYDYFTAELDNDTPNIDPYPLKDTNGEPVEVDETEWEKIASRAAIGDKSLLRFFSYDSRSKTIYVNELPLMVHEESAAILARLIEDASNVGVPLGSRIRDSRTVTCYVGGVKMEPDGSYRPRDKPLPPAGHPLGGTSWPNVILEVVHLTKHADTLVKMNAWLGPATEVQTVIIFQVRAWKRNPVGYGGPRRVRMAIEVWDRNPVAGGAPVQSMAVTEFGTGGATWNAPNPVVAAGQLFLSIPKATLFHGSPSANTVPPPAWYNALPANIQVDLIDIRQIMLATADLLENL